MNRFRMYSPLTVRTEPDSVIAREYSSSTGEHEMAAVDSTIAAYYAMDIEMTVEKDVLAKHGTKGLAASLTGPLSNVIQSIQPTVEAVGYELYGALDIEASRILTEREMAQLLDHCISQLSDGWGEAFEQRSIQTKDGNLYVSYQEADRGYRLIPERELHPYEMESQILR